MKAWPAQGGRTLDADKKMGKTPSQPARVSNDPAYLKGMKPKGRDVKKEDPKGEDSSKDGSVP